MRLDLGGLGLLVGVTLPLGTLLMDGPDGTKLRLGVVEGAGDGTAL